MALTYLRKNVTPQSRWGMALAVQGGYDVSRALIPSSIPGRQKPLDDAETLSHFGQANVSYLAPIGRGLTLTAGLFKSYIGYASLYARENFNYTRPYIADNSPYLLFGLIARYPVSDTLKLGFFLTNGYSYLSYVNNQPHYGAQVSWKVAPRLTFTQNLYYGPDQMNTALQFWRFFSDSILEWRDDRLTLALAYDIDTEDAAEQAAHPRTFWTGGAFVSRWNIGAPWDCRAPSCAWSIGTTSPPDLAGASSKAARSPPVFPGLWRASTCCSSRRSGRSIHDHTKSYFQVFAAASAP